MLPPQQGHFGDSEARAPGFYKGYAPACELLIKRKLVFIFFDEWDSENALKQQPLSRIRNSSSVTYNMSSSSAITYTKNH